MSDSATKVKKTAPPRKKACTNCTKAKVRCDLKRPSCLRCQSRKLACYYSTPASEALISTTTNGETNDLGSFALSTPASLSPTSARNTTVHLDNGHALHPVSLHTGRPNSLPTPEYPEDSSTHLLAQHDQQSNESPTSSGPARLDFSKVFLISKTDSNLIRDRWLGAFLPSEPHARPKVLPPHTVQYLSCVLRSFSKQMLRPGWFPPFVHPAQMTAVGSGGEGPLPLANCFSLIRMWEGREVGSEVMVAETVKREMDRLFDEHTTYDQMTLLAAFQAYLIYAMTAYFSSPTTSTTTSHSHSHPSSPTPLIPITQTHLANLQLLASALSTSGLIALAEALPTRPGWESWIVASTKRRALYTMYLFDNVFNARAEVPTFIAEELANLPVPASKRLWAAAERSDWIREYDMEMVRWGQGGELRISELWAPVGTLGEEEVKRRRERVGRWVEGVDEFGMMLFAVCAHIHGC